MKTLQHFQADDAIDAIADALLQDGGVIVGGLIEPGLLARCNAEIDPLLAAADPEHSHLNPALDAFFGKRTRHVSGLAGKSPLFAEQVMLHPLYMALCDRILLPNCADYVLNLAHVMDRGSGAEQQLLHRDEDIWIHMPRQRPELSLASMIAMVDFTRENGATVIVPGSHRWQDRARQPRPEEFACAEMPAGSVAIYLGSTLHAGGTNSSEQWRRGIHMSYCLGWLRTEENNCLAVSREVAKTLPRRAQQLIGYGVHDAIEDMGGYLGMVDMADPGHLLQ